MARGVMTRMCSGMNSLAAGEGAEARMAGVMEALAAAVAENTAAVVVVDNAEEAVSSGLEEEEEEAERWTVYASASVSGEAGEVGQKHIPTEQRTTSTLAVAAVAVEYRMLAAAVRIPAAAVHTQAAVVHKLAAAAADTPVAVVVVDTPAAEDRDTPEAH